MSPNPKPKPKYTEMKNLTTWHSSLNAVPNSHLLPLKMTVTPYGMYSVAYITVKSTFGDSDKQWVEWGMPVDSGFNITGIEFSYQVGAFSSSTYINRIVLSQMNNVGDETILLDDATPLKKPDPLVYTKDIPKTEVTGPLTLKLHLIAGDKRDMFWIGKIGIKGSKTIRIPKELEQFFP
jgi:hypothetical protein